MNKKMKLEVEMNAADYLALEAIARKRRISVSTVVCDLLSNALQRVDPRDFEAFPYEASSIFTEEKIDELAVIADLLGDDF